MSSRHSARRAIMARAESLTALGAMPSAQLTVESTLAFDEAVCDHFQNGIGSPRMKKARAEIGTGLKDMALAFPACRKGKPLLHRQFVESARQVVR
jgi:hypothetical protein